ncbi:winged helix-turn-helix transcriptional regulator [Pseudogemmobacter humi]|uniref:HTH-type transcriptional activator HxlR n=1 Tax=Pseudogemmobacter humi TaxID=2483812 RepID=A0A3P5XVM9_9RHOB|nr:helix-turn-helix domain-containing protein [Pseudogemmobacter humi]VDC33147.1 HTH-type transcriptional activator HxlR [Pseudogemmobacter humi]
MTGKAPPATRSYNEGCLAAHALDLVGDRWALLVVRELMLGPRRFGELRTGLPGISANVLTQRLDEMEAAGLIAREGVPGLARRQAWRLSPAGEGLWPVLKAFCHWGAGQPGHDPAKFISPTALMLSMRAMCARDRAGSHLVGVEMEGQSFTIRTAPGRYVVERGPAGPGALRFAGGTNAMAMAVYGPMPLAVTAERLIRFEGDIVQGQAFLDLFSLRAGQGGAAPVPVGDSPGIFGSG